MFDSELLSVGVLGEIDVEAGVVSFGETVLDGIRVTGNNRSSSKR